MRPLVFAALTLAGCGSDGDGNDARPPDSCDPLTQRLGTYLLHFERVSGNCGDPPDALVRVDSSPETDCTYDAEDVWSDNGCTVDSAITCPSDTGSTKLVGVTTQQDAAGERITGVVTLTLRNAQGVTTCIGTYRLTYTRQ